MSIEILALKLPDVMGAYLTLPSGWVQSTPALRPQYGPNAQVMGAYMRLSHTVLSCIVSSEQDV